MENKKLILIVEDEPALIKILSQKFQEEGFGVAEATDGEEGLGMAIEKHPDLILLDIVMPKMDGITMLEKLREDDWGKGAPVIILSNLTDASSAKKAFEKGARDYLIKVNWSLEDLLNKVKDKLS